MSSQSSEGLPAPVPSPAEFYVSRGDGQRHGPFTTQQLRSMMAGGARWTHAWHEGLHRWMPLHQMLQAALTPPSLPSRQIIVSSIPAWLLATAPILGSLVAVLLQPLGVPAIASYLLIVFALATIDITLRRRAKQSDESYWMWLLFFSLLGTITIPVYLYQRAKSLEHSLAYFWVAVALQLLAVVSLFF